MSLNLIEEYLYLGDFEAMQSIKVLNEFKIEIVLSVIHIPIPDQSKYESIDYHEVFAEDNNTQDLLSYFQETNEIIAFGQLTKRAVLVHCMAGISRSATVVIAFLMNKYRIPLGEAYKMVYEKRSFISPNNGFIEQLRLYEVMAFTLDPNNKKFRNHLLNTILSKQKFADYFELYFERRNRIESERMVCFKSEYLCSQKDCCFILFNDLNLLDNFWGTESHCKYLFIEPQEWIKQIIKERIESQSNGDLSINCPRCLHIVGHFSERFGCFQCSCVSHEGLGYLYFKIDSNCVRIKNLFTH